VHRHEGQYKAIREVFGDTRVIFCAKHLAQNISMTFGKQSFMLTGFWGLMTGTLTEVQWWLRLDAARVRWPVDSSKGRVIQWLFRNVEHYCPSHTFPFTGDQASIRIEGSFGVVMIRTDHQKLLLPVIVAEFIKIAFEGLREWP
jgi:hypothetical protein